MKKVMLTVSAFALVAMMAACGGVESKAEDFAKKNCECLKETDQAKQDKCLEDLTKEVEAYEKELKGEDSTKYFAKKDELNKKGCEGEEKEGEQKAE